MRKIMITGATGYVGSMLIKHLLQENGDVEIAAPVRNLEKAENRLQEIWGKTGKVRFFQADQADRKTVEWAASACGNIDYLVHCASVTKSSEMISHPVETIESIINITQNILELAKRCHVKSMVYLSSMEVYGTVNCSGEKRVTEDEASQGEVALLHARSCYPLAKRMAENICYAYYKEYGVPVKIARLAQTFGAGILPEDNRVFAQFARAVKEDRDIVLHTEGRSMGNYCGIHDAVRGILTILERGADGEAYNVVNEENTMTIRQMAALVADQIAGGKVKVVYDIPQDSPYGYAPDTGLRLSAKKLESLGWRAKEDMEEMYRQAIAEMKYNSKR